MALKTDVPTPEPAGGTAQWVGLEELAAEPAFQEMLHREFPEDATAWADPVTRRTFLALAGASAGLAGIGCSPRPASREKIFPYTRQPEQMTPGVPLFFATGFTLGGVCTGVLAKSREGRPVKLEGNPTHPSSIGAIDAITQASLLGLYDPDRSRQIYNRERVAGWETAITTLRGTLERLRTQGKAIRILTDTVGSPALGGLLLEFLATYPAAKWVQYEPANRDNVREGARLAYGEPVNTAYDFTKAYRVLSLDADFLTCLPGSTRYSRDFNRLRNTHLKEAGKADHPKDAKEPTGHVHQEAGGRVPTAEEMNRLYVVESMLTATGAVADHRLAMRSSDVEAFARAVARELGVAEAGDAPVPAAAQGWIAPLVADLKAHAGRCVVVAGDHLPPAVHALAHAMNGALGNIGTTVLNFAPAEVRPDNQTAQFRELVAEMADKKVDALLILGGNPVYSSPADVDFKAALAKVPLKVHMGLYLDETGTQCDWHLNEAHYLETWGDGRAHDGTASICQPLIAPLFGGRSPLELLAALMPDRGGELTPRAIVKAFWQKNWPANGGSTTNFEAAWQKALQDGVIPNSARPRVDRQPNAGAIPPYTAAPAGMEIVFRPDPAVFDGRFANNGWLQELPKPITKLTWDNAIVISPRTAEKHQLGQKYKIESTGGGEHGRVVADMAELTVGGRTLKAAVWIQPGHADDSITLHLGYGRERAGIVASQGKGFNAYLVRTADAVWVRAGGVSLRDTGEDYILASTQAHFRMEGRRPVRQGTLEEFRQNEAERKKNPNVAPFAKVPAIAAPEWRAIDENVPGSPHEYKGEKPNSHKEEHKDDHAHHDNRLIPLSVVPATNKEGRRWAMAIDLTACHGCSACVTACMAENNIPVVGKHEVTRGREMHWIRVDRYYEGSPDEPANLTTHFQPVPCQQCEKAPCEVVCPVAATMHSFDGLNDMVYNRCVGTRYCSNNCPYKVRRFNFLTHADWKTDTYKLMRNPEVTVRERGVMEKCTYCVQRIRAAEIEAERVGREIRDGEIVTACEAACPAGAIVFGDLSVKNSRVNVWKAQPTNYGLLAELNTMPRTTYLAAVRNPNPAMPKGA